MENKLTIDDMVVEIIPPYYIDKKGKVFNLNTQKYVKVNEDNIFKFKSNGKVESYDVTEELKLYNEYLEEIKEQNNIEEKSKDWLFKCNETKQRFSSIEEAAEILKTNKRAIYLNLNKMKDKANGYTFTFNPNIKK